MNTTHTDNTGKVPAKIGLALGGGFARGIAHVGVLKVLEELQVPLHCIAGVSAGSVVAAAFASGAGASHIGRVGSTMRFTDVARWTVSRMGFARSDRMGKFLQKLLNYFRFEDMRIPLGIVATDLQTGDPVVFHSHGDVVVPVRASCSYPGLFQPVRSCDRLLVDGAMSMEIPAEVCRSMGATRVISVCLPSSRWQTEDANVFNVVNRCFQIMQSRTEQAWRDASDLIISPDVTAVGWNGFTSSEALVKAGEQAARQALLSAPSWLALAAGPERCGATPAIACQTAHSPTSAALAFC